jgi:glycine/D-amino acid oxidase-like deaminating enzyme
MIDYLIVGSGLAGISFAETALQNQKSILIIDNQSQSASLVAGGLYNPVILKRFSEVWQAQQQLEVLDSFYQKLETKLNIKVDYKIPILRKFFSVEEQNNWFSASDNKLLAPFLSLNLVKTKYKGINSPFDYGQVLQTGYVDTKLLLEGYRKYLLEKKLLLEESFDLPLFYTLIYNILCIIYIIYSVPQRVYTYSSSFIDIVYICYITQ